MTSRSTQPWWAARGPRWLLLLHVIYLFGLCQLQLSEADAGRLLGNSAEPRSIATVLERGGVRGALALYFGVHEQVPLYHRYAEVFWRGYDPRRSPDDPATSSLTVYRDVPVEYQPGKLLLMAVPALISADYAVYLPLFVLWSGGLYLAAVLGAMMVTGETDAARASRILGWSFAFLLLFGPQASGHLDQAVALICVLAWSAFKRASERCSMSGFAVAGCIAGAGVLVKIAPGVLLPAAGIALLLGGGRPQWRAAIAFGAGFGGTVTLLHTASWLRWGEGYLASYAYHLDRGIQIESTWAGLLTALRHWVGPLGVEYNYGSYHLVTPFTASVRALFPLALSGIAVAVAARLRLTSRTDGTANAATARALPGITLALLLALLLTSKVFCFNYLLWLTPLAPALLGGVHARLPGAVLYAAGLGLTQVYRLFDYAHAKLTLPWPAVLVINLRNAVLLALLGWLIWRLPLLCRIGKTAAGGAGPGGQRDEAGAGSGAGVGTGTGRSTQ